MKNEFYSYFKSLNKILPLVTLGLASVLTSCGDDDDGPGNTSLDFNQTTLSVSESSTAPLMLTVNFSQPLPSDVQVVVELSGTATYGSDYTTSPDGSTGSATLSLSAGATSATVSLTPVNNPMLDGDRTVILTLTGASGVIPGTESSATVTIQDDETSVALTAGSILSNDYSAGGTLVFLYSTDDGVTYSPEVPSGLVSGQSVQVKINNGTIDLPLEDFNFDWSTSTVNPTEINSDVAIFSDLSMDFTVNVTVSDIIELILIKRSNGAVMSVNTENGMLTDAFAFTLNGDSLNNIRSLVYHVADGQFYATTTNRGGADLISLDRTTKQATILNENPDNDWDAIADMLVLDNGDLLVTHYDNTSAGGQALATFNTTTGDRSTPLLFTSMNDICCGMGMIFGSNSSEVIVGVTSGILGISDTNGAISADIQLTAAPEFTEIDLSNGYIQNMVKTADGTVYGIINVNDFSSVNDTYLVTIDITTGVVSNVVALDNSTETSERFHGLALVPAHTF